MKLKGPPSGKTLRRLYHELSRLGAPTEGQAEPWSYGAPSPEQVIVLAAQASRYEPRLLWALVSLLATEYMRFDPLKLRRELHDARWPGSLGVAFAFAELARPSQELSDVARFVMQRTPAAAGEQFFLSTHRLAGTQMRREAEESLEQYRRWGFLSRELPIAKELGSTARGSLGRATRMNVLRRIALRRDQLTLSDYLDALAGRASYRQAKRDLATAPFLRRTGKTRGARYMLAKPSGTSPLDARS